MKTTKNKAPAKKVRKTFWLDPEQDLALQAEAERMGETESSIVRKILDKKFKRA